MPGFQSTLARLRKQLARPIHTFAARNIIESAANELEPPSYYREQLIRELDLRHVPLRWPGGKVHRALVSTADGDFDPLEIAMGFFTSGYICNESALYWNSLSNRIPRHIYVAEERRKQKSESEFEPLDHEIVQAEFEKAARSSKRTATYGWTKFTLLERAHSSNIGVVKQKVAVGQSHSLIRVTNLERTLLDVAVHPQYCNGIKSVLGTFSRSNAQISVTRLISYYEHLSFVYPYWQRIGFLLQKSRCKRAAEIWRIHFGNPVDVFYVDREYNSNWMVDPTWKVAYPPSLR